MDIYLIICVIILSYIGALITVLILKEKPTEMFSGGTIAWLIIVLGSLVYPNTNTIIILVTALIVGITAQAIVQMKRKSDKILNP